MSRLAVFEWLFRTIGGRRGSADAFAHTHLCSSHPKNQGFINEKKTLRYGSVCFLPAADAIVPAKAYLNRWSN